MSRTKHYATIVYQESMPENLDEILNDLHIRILKSPLHDKDLTKDGTLKKPHYHILLMFDSLKSRNQAKEIIDSFGGVGCEVVNSVKAYARYLAHLDNPEKAQYSVDDIVAFGGANIDLTEKEIDKRNAVIDVCRICVDNGFSEFCDLVDYLIEFRPEYVDTVVSSSYFINSYLKSKKFSFEFEEAKRKQAELEEIKNKEFKKVEEVYDDCLDCPF